VVESYANIRGLQSPRNMPSVSWRVIREGHWEMNLSVGSGTAKFQTLSFIEGDANVRQLTLNPAWGSMEVVKDFQEVFKDFLKPSDQNAVNIPDKVG
jgi:hypothetical protein